MEQPNFSYIDTLSGGNEEFKNKLVSVIKKEFPQEKSLYFNNFSNKDLKLTGENVHKLKYKISILGLEKSYKIAEDYEDNLRKGSISGHEKFHKILDTITGFLDSL